MEDIYEIVAEKLGATRGLNKQAVAVYVPDRDNKNQLIANHSQWVENISLCLANICGGYTIYNTRGGWHNEKTKETIKENTVIINSFILDLDRFVKNLPILRSVLHDFGRSTNQDAVAIEFDSVFYTIYFD